MRLKRLSPAVAGATAALAMLAPGAAPAQVLTPIEAAKIDALAAAAMARTHEPSVSVAVVRGGKIAFAKAYGMARLSPAAPATAATRYNIGSVSKQFTAQAVLMLGDAGKLSLDDTVGRFFPRLSGANTVTLRRLLSHTAGYRNYWTVDYLPLYMHRPVAPQAIVDRWGREPLDFVPGDRWHYTNTDYVIAGRIVEQVSGQPLGRFLQTRAFGPLGMTSAASWETTASRPDSATGYTRLLLEPLRPAQPVPLGWEFGAGGLGMTAQDLARWDIGMIGQSRLKPASYLSLETAVKRNDGKDTGYGLGVYVDVAAGGHRRIHHDGSTPGFLAENRVYPDDRAAIVVLANADTGGATRAIADGVEALLFPTVAGAAPPPRRAPPDSDPTPPGDPSPVAKGLIAQLAAGSLDRHGLSADANDYFTGDVLGAYHRTLARLGPPTAVEMKRHDLIDGLNASLYVVTWPHQTLIAILRTEPGGKVEEFTMFEP
jgi:D-alanyl-D-alanine carboxypeptidase